MKTILGLEGQRRIFSKALQSVLGSPSLTQKDPIACKRADAKTTLASRANPHTLKSTEIIAASLENPIQMETYGPEYTFSPNSVIEAISYDTATNSDNYVQMELNNDDYTLPADYFTETTASDADVWMKDSHFDSAKEILDMVPNNETDPWILKNRLMALQQLGMLPNDTDAWIMNNRLTALRRLESDSHGQYSSTNISPEYRTHSPEEMSRMAVNSSNYGAFTILPQCSRNSLSSDRDPLKDVPLSNRRCTFETCHRSVIRQQDGIKLELAPLSNFRENRKSSGENSLALSEVKSLKSDYVKSSQPISSDIDCCETFHDKPVAKNKVVVSKLSSYKVASLMNFKSRTGFFDSHCHIDFLFGREKFQGTYADYIDEHRDSYPESYKGCIAVFCKPFTFAKEKLWRKHLEQDNVWGAFGCHPRSAKFYDSQIEKDLEIALDHPKVKALGEIGLDYSKGNKCSKLEQHHVFRRQLKIAQKRKLRVVIHCRDADDDTIKIMHEILPKDTIFHLHCFTGSWKRAQRWIEEFPNVFIGITNLVTFPSATDTHEVAKQLPLNRLLLETDAPYFVPSMASKGTNSSHPGMAIHVAAKIAELKDIPLEDVLNWTSANTRIVYNITEI